MRHIPEAGIPSVIAGAVQRFHRWQGQRRAIFTLSHFSDATLSDMGLTRDSIESAVRHGRG